jgi:hypothetical protein
MAVTQISSRMNHLQGRLIAQLDGDAVKIVPPSGGSYTLVSSGAKAVGVIPLRDGRWELYYITGTITLNGYRSNTDNPTSAGNWSAFTP